MRAGARTGAWLVALVALAAGPVHADHQVRLVWSGTTGEGSLGSSQISVSQRWPETLTLDLVIDVDDAGLRTDSVSMKFDPDLGDELDLVGFQMLTWGNAKASRTYIPMNASEFRSSQESSADQQGELFGVFHTSFILGSGPSNLSLTLARMVFVTKPSQVASDGDDVFSGEFSPDGSGRGDGVYTDTVLQNPLRHERATVTYGAAAVDARAPLVSIPPWTLGASGVVLLAAAWRARRKPKMRREA